MEEEKKKNIEILIKSVIISQQKGAYTLKDASLLHEVVVSLVGKEGSKKVDEQGAISALIQGASIGQKAGAFTLDDASLVFSAIKWFEEQQSKKLETIEEES